MEKHDIVMIYTDPITKRKPEGKAILLNKVRELNAHGLELWEVCFEDDDGTVYEREV